MENTPTFVFDEAQRVAYDAMPPGAPREFMKDLCLGRPFRRDLFVKGMRRTDPERALDRLVLAACKVLPEEPVKLGVPVGQAEVPPELWGPIATALNEGPQSLGRLRSLTPDRNPNAAELLTVLTDTGCTLPALRDPGTTEATTRFNRVVAEQYAAEGRAGAQFAMASPVNAAGVPCTWLELALAAQPEIVDPEPDMALLMRRLMPHLNEENHAKAVEMTAVMVRDRLPIWRRFGII